jgi:hypothetical protein
MLRAAMVMSSPILLMAMASSALAMPATPARAAAQIPGLPPVAPTDWANSWIPLGQDSAGVIWLVRAGDMTNVDNYLPSVWVTKDHSHDKSTKARLSRSFQIFDCMAGTADVRATIGFSAAGAVLWSVQSPHPDPKPIAASSMADAVRKGVCPKLAPPVTNR